MTNPISFWAVVAYIGAVPIYATGNIHPTDLRPEFSSSVHAARFSTQGDAAFMRELLGNNPNHRVEQHQIG